MAYFHAFSATDEMFSHNLLCGCGRIVAISAARRGHPEWANIMSPYEAFTRERPKEELFERIRARDFPDRPTRLGSIFLFPRRELADACNLEWWGGAKIILEALILPGSTEAVLDSRQLNATSDEWAAAAGRYWAGELTPDPRPEVVVCGTVELVGWEPYGRLLTNQFGGTA